MAYNLFFLGYFIFTWTPFRWSTHTHTHTHGYLVYFFKYLPIVWFFDLVFPSPTYGTYNVTSMLFTLFFFNN